MASTPHSWHASTIAPKRWPRIVSLTRPTVWLSLSARPSGLLVSMFITAASVPPYRSTDFAPQRIGTICVKPDASVAMPSRRE